MFRRWKSGSSDSRKDAVHAQVATGLYSVLFTFLSLRSPLLSEGHGSLFSQMTSVGKPYAFHLSKECWFCFLDLQSKHGNELGLSDGRVSYFRSVASETSGKPFEKHEYI